MVLRIDTHYDRKQPTEIFIARPRHVVVDFMLLATL